MTNVSLVSSQLRNPDEFALRWSCPPCHKSCADASESAGNFVFVESVSKCRNGVNSGSSNVREHDTLFLLGTAAAPVSPRSDTLVASSFSKLPQPPVPKVQRANCLTARHSKQKQHDDDVVNGISRRSQVMMRQAQHYHKKKTAQQLQHGPLSARRELQSHPLAGQAQACGRLTKGGWAGGPDGTYRDPWCSQC